jgi:hypothetical protein
MAERQGFSARLQSGWRTVRRNEFGVVVRAAVKQPFANTGKFLAIDRLENGLRLEVG